MGQGDHILIAAPTKAGKTTMARRLIKKRGHTVVFVTKTHDDTIRNDYRGFYRAHSWSTYGPSRGTRRSSYGPSRRRRYARPHSNSVTSSVTHWTASGAGTMTAGPGGAASLTNRTT